MVNVEYIHKVIEQQWDITIPYNPKLENPKFAANMKYLLTAVDVANEMLNGRKTTDYGNSEYATLYAADTIATNEAVRRLIEKQIEPEFFITTTPDTSSFGFKMSAKGKFLVDWGDGQTETITRNNTTEKWYSHKYDTADEYKIGIGGRATEYSPGSYIAAISFADNTKIASIDGSLGAIFGTIDDGSTLATQPRFCDTFMYCSNLSGEIPSGLFTGVRGAPILGMFYNTFRDCSGLTTIPSGLFAGIQGAPAEGMFRYTFANCRGLTEIPSGLFAGISGAPAQGMFNQTFANCSGLTGPSAKIGDKYLYQIWPDATSAQVGSCYYNATGLTDYDDIPSNWRYPKD